MNYIKYLSIVLVGCFVTALYSFNYKGEPIERPDNWVLRSNLDSRIRMISIGLNNELWVAYNTQTASLYKAWKGGVLLEGAVFDKGDGQPVSTGNTYMEEADGIPWVLLVNGSEVTPKVQYRGHTILNNKISLKYELHYNNQVIKIEEQPEYTKNADKVGFIRSFKVSGVPKGTQVGLKMHLSSIDSKGDFKTNGKFVTLKAGTETVSGKQFQLIEGTLILNNGGTSFSVNITPKPYTPPVVEEEEEERAVAAMFARLGCLTCHDTNNKIIGPSFSSIAYLYRNTDSNKDLLTQRVINGTIGTWGEIPMIPHTELSVADARTLVSYILNIDSASENQLSKVMPEANTQFEFHQQNVSNGGSSLEKPGIAFNIYQLDYELYGFPQITEKMIPQLSGSANFLHAYNEDFYKNFRKFDRNFAIQASGFLNIKEDMKVEFRLASNDGTRLFIDGEMVVETIGNMSAVMEGVVSLKAGKHPFVYEYYKRSSEKRMTMQWRPYGTDTYVVVPPEVFTYTDALIKESDIQPESLLVEDATSPGDGASLEDLHPSLTLAQARPESFKPRVAGMDFMSDGRLVVSTWDSIGAVYILDGVKGNNPEQIKVTRAAFGLAEPLGLAVADDEIYVLQKQELTKLIDLNGDGIIDEYQTVCNTWTGTNNHHEFAFGLIYKDGYFYGTLSVALNGPGPSAPVQASDRGKAFKISKETGEIEFIATGLRTPNGIGFGVDGEMFIADNQGDWLPANKIVHLVDDAWYGSRAGHMEETENMAETLPVVYLEHDKIANSPSQSAVFNVGPYRNQMVFGDVTHGGLKRVFAEKVKGEYQGVVFRFTQGLEAGVNRIVWGPDSTLYIGGVGHGGNWGQNGKLKYGLQKVKFNHKTTFEMLSIKAKPNGVEIEFTEPLKVGAGENAIDYAIRQWWYKPTGNYGGPNMDEETLEIKNITISPDRKRVTLELPGMKEKHVLYFRLNKGTVLSESNESLWTTEGWYSMNNIPNE